MKVNSAEIMEKLIDMIEELIRENERLKIEHERLIKQNNIVD